MNLSHCGGSCSYENGWRAMGHRPALWPQCWLLSPDYFSLDAERALRLGGRNYCFASSFFFPDAGDEIQSLSHARQVLYQWATSLALSFVFVYFFETGSWYVVQAGLELAIFLLQTPECWDYRHNLVFFLIGLNFFTHFLEGSVWYG
jgi:hypothetical protein